MKLRFTFFAAFLAAAVSLAIAFAPDDTFQGVVIKKPFDSSVHGKAARPSSTQILFHGGPVMNQTDIDHPNTVYVIYYGTFPNNTQPIINNFLLDLSGSDPLGVNSTYNGGSMSPAAVPKTFAVAAPYFDNYSQGAQLSGGSITKIIAHAFSAGLTADRNGVYLLITAPDVKIPGFCNSFCAYHTTSATISPGKQIRYALIPDPTQRCSGCNGGSAVFGDTSTPNGDFGADTITDDIMHELSETLTDPDLNAWFTQGGAENADLCNYVYGTVYQDSHTGPHYNFKVSGRKYLIQQLWKNVGAGACAAQ